MNMVSKINNVLKTARPVRLIKRFKKNEEGVTAVEFALVGGPFFLLIFAIIETSLFFFANQYLETIIDDVARLYRTGQLVNTTAPTWDIRTKQGFDDEICRRIIGLFECDRIITQLDIAEEFSAVPKPPRPDAANTITGSFAPPERFPIEICPLRVVQVTASYEWQIFTNYSAPLVTEGLDNKSLINVTAIVRTEDFPTPLGTTC